MNRPREGYNGAVQAVHRKRGDCWVACSNSVFRTALLLVGIAAACSSTVLMAGPTNRPTGCWRWELQTGAGVFAGRPSGADVVDDCTTRTRLAGRGVQTTDVDMFLGFEIGYATEDGETVLSAGAKPLAPWHVSLGRRSERLGSVRASVLYQEVEVWRDPYLVGDTRRETDERKVGTRVSWEAPGGQGPSVSLGWMHVEVKNDTSGAQWDRLGRDGADYVIDITQPWACGSVGMLSASVGGFYYDREGDADTACGGKAGLEHIFSRGRVALISQVDIAGSRYGHEHPLFGKTRQEVAWSISETIRFAGPFGDDLYLLGMGSYQQCHSNISFFDRSLVLGVIGIGYRGVLN